MKKNHLFISVFLGLFAILLSSCAIGMGYADITFEKPPTEEEVENRAPEFLTPLNGQSFQLLEGKLAMVAVKAYDPDGDNVRLSAMSLPLSAGFSCTGGYAATGFITWAPSFPRCAGGYGAGGDWGQLSSSLVAVSTYLLAAV